MANAQGPFGLRYVSGPRVVIPCYIAASYATALYKGDPVVLSNEADDRDATGHYPSVELASLVDDGVWFGVIEGFDEDPDNLTRQYKPASTERMAYVILATPNTVFEIRGCGGGTPTDLFPGLNAVGVQGTASTVWGTSGVQLDEGSATAPSDDQSNPMLILSFKNVEDNELGDYAIYRVLVNTGYNAVGERLGVAGI